MLMSCSVFVLWLIKYTFRVCIEDPHYMQLTNIIGKAATLCHNIAHCKINTIIYFHLFCMWNSNNVTITAFQLHQILSSLVASSRVIFPLDKWDTLTWPEPTHTHYTASVYFKWTASRPARCSLKSSRSSTFDLLCQLTDSSLIVSLTRPNEYWLPFSLLMQPPNLTPRPLSLFPL